MRCWQNGYEFSFDKESLNFILSKKLGEKSSLIDQRHLYQQGERERHAWIFAANNVQIPTSNRTPTFWLFLPDT